MVVMLLPGTNSVNTASRVWSSLETSLATCTVQYMQYSTVQCCTVQYSTVQYSTVQYSTVQPRHLVHGLEDVEDGLLLPQVGQHQRNLELGKVVSNT